MKKSNMAFLIPEKDASPYSRQKRYLISFKKTQKYCIFKSWVNLQHFMEM
jgi:hypothetical protein